jgi:hypothetical protein
VYFSHSRSSLACKTDSFVGLSNFSKGYSPEVISDMLEVELETVQKILDK